MNTTNPSACPACGAQNRAEAKFCAKCRAQLAPVAVPPANAHAGSSVAREKPGLEVRFPALAFFDLD